MSVIIESRRLKASLTGLGGGFFSGLLGVGGGIVMVPLLTGVLRLPQRVAHGTSLAIIVFTGGLGLLAYALAGNVDWRLVAALGAGSVIGAYAGARAVQHVPEELLRRLFGLFLVAVAVRMLIA